MPSDGLVVVIPIYDANITEPDLDCDGIVDSVDTDIDGDGVLNNHDAFPLNSAESVDTDGDGIGNNADLDDDNDGYSDAEEIAFGSDPLDAHDIPVTVSNDGFIVTPLVGTSSQVSFAVALEHKPESNVTINYSSADETVAKPTTSTMTFTPENWYRSQVVTVDIFNPNSSTEIVFEPTISSDSNYNDKMLEQVSIVSHQLLLFEPVDKIVYSEFNMSIAVNMAYVGDNEENITVTLDTAPNGMTLDVNNSRLLWTPALGDEGENKTVALTVSDGTLTKTLSFELHVALPTLLATSIVNDKLIITDSNSSLNGLSIKALDGAVLADYRLYKLTTADTPAFTQGESVVGETLLIKGNIGKKVQVLYPLQGLVETDELLSFHTKSYFGSGNWRRVDYDYDFNGTASEPVYVLNTESLFGVVAFTKKFQNQQKALSLKQKRVEKAYKTQKNISNIHCIPKTWSFLNLTDYDNQICTFDDKPNFTLQIFNHKQFYRPIEETASWVIQAQDKLIELGMPYKNYSALSFQDTFPESHGHTATYDKVKDSFFVEYPTISNYKISLIHTHLTYRDTQITIYHEYFHQSQAAIQNNTFGVPKAKWLIESSAVWFSDYVDNNSGYAYEMFGTYIRLLSYGLTRLHTEIMSGGGFGSTRRDIIDSNFYHRGIFLEMIEKYCTGFTQYIPYLFSKDDNDVTSLQHLSNVIYSSKCNFGTPIGAGNESRIETALLYYQYISAIKNNQHLINQNLHSNFFSGAEVVYTVTEKNAWSKLSLDDYIDVSHKGKMNPNSIDSQALTLKFDAVEDTLPKCQERYIRIKSDNVLYVSIASNDERLADTPSSMLGDMKQIALSTKGVWDFSYLTDKDTHKTIYPELYLTVIDPVDGKSNKVEIGIGLRRRNLISSIDGQDVCAEYVPQITQTTVVANGEIPSQYRDVTQPLQYIDKIKITCVESGEVFNASVASDGKWSTNIHITFNGNKSRFFIEGYNASDSTRIIARQRLEIVR